MSRVRLSSRIVRRRRPEKLGSLAKDFGKIAGELKDVPKEFKEGLEEAGVETVKTLPEGDDDEKKAE